MPSSPLWRDTSSGSLRQVSATIAGRGIVLTERVLSAGVSVSVRRHVGLTGSLLVLQSRAATLPEAKRLALEAVREDCSAEFLERLREVEQAEAALRSEQVANVGTKEVA